MVAGALLTLVVAGAWALGQALPERSTPERGSVTGVDAATIGSTDAPDQRRGVQSPAAAENAAVSIDNIRGSEGVAQDPQAPEGASPQGSIQSIPGIEGIDAVRMENLEAVLRMQARVTETQPQGGARTAAALMTMENEEDASEEMTDAREEHQEFELEGS